VSGGPSIWREIGARYEQYCIDLSKAILSTIEVTSSFKYQFKKTIDSPDFLLRENGRVRVAIECKAKKMSFAAKFSTNPMLDAKQGYSEIIKGVAQLWRFFSHCRRAANVAAVHPDAVGIVLTMDPWLEISNHRDRVFAEARKLSEAMDSEILEEDRRHVLFCPIDDYEITLQRASDESFLNAILASTKPEFNGWSLFNVHQQTTQNKDIRHRYPFEARIGEINPGWKIGGLLESNDQAS
jgi:hypothetical protein